jgi:DNA polymerase III subunit beta
VNISIDKDVLFNGLQRVSNIVPQKPTLPVLSNFLLRALQGRLSISGTDMDISMTTSVACEIVEEGDITVNARRFVGVIRELPPGIVTLRVERDKLKVVFSKGESVFDGIPATDYPALRDTIEGVEAIVSSTDLSLMVEKTGFSVSSDRTRLALTGIYWKVTPEEMVMVSTDGHRLSLVGKKTETVITASAESIVPQKSLMQAAQLASGGAELKQVVFGTGAILFEFDGTTVFSKLIEGPYPNFRQVIPTTNSKKVTVPVEPFAAAVRRVSVLSSSITHQVKLEITPGQITISTRNDEIGGESHETVDVVYDGEPLTAGYNAAFLSEILRRIDSTEIVLELETPTTACIIKPVGEQTTGEYVYLIMPLRLSE